MKKHSDPPIWNIGLLRFLAFGWLMYFIGFIVPRSYRKLLRFHMGKGWDITYNSWKHDTHPELFKNV